MPKKPDTLSHKVILMTVAIAALTSIGAEVGKTWLPAVANYLWSNITSSKVIFVTVLRAESQTPISNALVTAAHPEQPKSILAKAETDGDGRAVLGKVKLSDFFLKVTYSSGGKVYTHRRDVIVDKWPHRITIAEGAIWDSQDIQTTGAPVISAPLTSSATQSTAPWLDIAAREVGVKELPPPGSNTRIEEYHASTSLGRQSQDIPWGCSFVSWVLTEAKIQGNIKSARCVDYLKFGVPIGEARRGAIAILIPSKDVSEARSALTGFVVSSDVRSVTLIVGNVDNQVTIANFPLERVRGFRWPG